MRAIIRLLYQKLFMQMMRMRLKKVGRRKNIEAGRSKSTVKVLLPFGLKKACSMLYTFSKCIMWLKEYANVTQNKTYFMALYNLLSGKLLLLKQFLIASCFRNIFIYVRSLSLLNR